MQLSKSINSKLLENNSSISKSSIKFPPKKQDDSFLFLKFLLEKLNEENNRNINNNENKVIQSNDIIVKYGELEETRSNLVLAMDLKINNSIITDLFKTQIRISSICESNKNNKEVCFINDFVIDFTDEIFNKNLKIKSLKELLNLQKNGFSRKCEFCLKNDKNSKCRMIKRKEIYKTSNYLIIKLPRIRILDNEENNNNNNTNRNLQKFIKNEDEISFDEELNLYDFIYRENENDKNFIKYKCIYKLYGIVCHQRQLNDGHYYCYVKNNNEWIKFDDNYTDDNKMIIINDEDEIKKIFKSKEAYILFYECDINENI